MDTFIKKGKPYTFITSVVCSEHFKEYDIDRTSLSCVRLRYGAIPSVFTKFSSYMQDRKYKRKPPTIRIVSDTDTDTETKTSLEQPTANSSSPTKAALKRKLGETEFKLKSSRKKIKTLLQSKRRLEKKNAELTSVLSDLRKRELLSTNSIEILETCSHGVEDLLKRHIQKSTKQTLPTVYSAGLRAFALTLNFYSPRAYRYVRKLFDTCLPHPRTMEKWLQSVEDRPGFSNVAFSVLHNHVLATMRNNSSCIFSLIIDEMAIRQHIEWDGQKYHGFIDMGTELDDDNLPIAREALVFMVVSMNCNLKSTYL